MRDFCIKREERRGWGGSFFFLGVKDESNYSSSKKVERKWGGRLLIKRRLQERLMEIEEMGLFNLSIVLKISYSF